MPGHFRFGWRPSRPSCCRFPTGISTTPGSVRDQLRAAGLRVDLDDRQEKIGYKIREAQLQKVPYMLVVGDRESAERTVSVRTRTGGDQGASSVSDFLAKAQEEIETKGPAVRRPL